MSEPVEWQADGTPRSARFDDIYRSCAGGLAQARHVFLDGCGLPGAWQGRPSFTILETGFGLGLNFLAAWQAWRADPQRAGLLHFVSVEAHPVSAADVLRSAADWPELAELARTLADSWWGLLPGVHRLMFEGGRVQLTLAVGDVQPMLRDLVATADAVFLDGFSPGCNPVMWQPSTLKGVARHCARGARVATWTIAREVRDALAEAGFVVHKAPGLPPKRDCLHGRYDPAWTPKTRINTQANTSTRSGRGTPSHAVVLGAGLAGAAVAQALAQRGTAVQVLDAAGAPAAGASALPVGLMAPHVSVDDAPLSRLTRAGVRLTLTHARALLHEGTDWQACGALQRQGELPARLPADWIAADGTLTAFAQDWMHLRGGDVWHARAAWVRPAALVRAWLAAPGVTFCGGKPASRLARDDDLWVLLDASGAELARTACLVLATAHATQTLLETLPKQDRPVLRSPLDRVAGQVALGPWTDALQSALPAHALNGHGHFIPAVPGLQADGVQPGWMAGSTYERATPMEPASALQANLERVAWLARGFTSAPAGQAQAELERQAQAGQIRLWAGERATTANRLPLVGEWHLPANVGDGPDAPRLLMCTAFGSRGLSLAALCAELVVSQACGEPWPLGARLAAAVRA